MKRVLICDDSILARMVLREALPDDGIEIHEAVNGKDAIEKFRDIDPHILFLDLTMPEVGGVEVLRRLRSIKHKTRIVVISADVQKKTMESVMLLGATEMLKKPPSKEDILRIIAEAKQES